MARIDDDRVEDVRALLRRLQPETSPFRTLPDLHFARLLVVQRLVQQQRPVLLRRGARLLDLVTHGTRREQRPDPIPHPYLLSTFTVDRPAGPDEAWFDGLAEHLGAQADAIWGGCTGYPGHRDRAAFRQFFRTCSLPAGYAFVRAADCTVGDAIGALRLRQELAGLAAATQDLPDSQLPHQLRRVLADRRPAPSLQPAAGPAVLAEPAPASVELADIQGLVCSGYGFHLAATHLHLRIAAPLAARRWLAGAAGRVSDAASAGGRPARALHIGLTHAGLGRLGLPQRQLDAFPEQFRQGMWAREALLTRGPGTQTWRWPFDRAGAVHVLLLLSATDRATLDPWVAELRRELAGGGFDIVAGQQADRIRTAAPGPGRFVEHFGFADGLSRPGVDGWDAGTTGDVLPPGEFVLGYRDLDRDIAGRGLPATLARNGSYLVYRKLEQDVAAFRAVCDAVAHRFPAGGAAEVAAKLIGRRQDGTPLTGPAGPVSTADSSFGYAADPVGLACPIGAHVRRANPRDALHGRPELARRHQMLRRGIPYGPFVPAGSEPDSSVERGLLFLAVVGDLGRQFEFVQVEWLTDGDVFGLGRDADVLAGGGPEARVVIQGNQPTFVPVPRPVVSCRGGDYFLLPGLRALRSLGDLP
jgi:Dyp-type peroxidase family